MSKLEKKVLRKGHDRLVRFFFELKMFAVFLPEQTVTEREEATINKTSVVLVHHLSSRKSIMNSNEQIIINCRREAEGTSFFLVFFLLIHCTWSIKRSSSKRNSNRTCHEETQKERKRLPFLDEIIDHQFRVQWNFLSSCRRVSFLFENVRWPRASVFQEVYRIFSLCFMISRRNGTGVLFCLFGLIFYDEIWKWRAIMELLEKLIDTRQSDFAFWKKRER